MTRSEYDLWVQNGVTEITEAMIGYDGVVIAASRSNDTDWNLTLEQLYLALAAEIVQDGQLVRTPTRTGPRSTEACPTRRSM